MFGKFKVAHLIGITREHENEFRHAEMVLTKQGYICFAPVIYNLNEYNSMGPYPNILDEMCYEKLCNCDLVVIVTPSHIGKSTSLRIQQAREMCIPIYTFENDKLEWYPF